MGEEMIAQMSDLPLTAEDLQEPRRASELYAWCVAKVDEIVDHSGKDVIRFAKGS